MFMPHIYILYMNVFIQICIIVGCRKVENNKNIMSMKLGRSVSLVSCTMFCGKSNLYIGLQVTLII